MLSAFKATLTRSLQTSTSARRPSKDSCSPRRILTTRLLLERLVPGKLADMILDKAQFWTSAIIEYTKPIHLKASASEDANTHSCLIVTDEMRKWMPMGAYRLRRVVSEMVSRDQGWDPENAETGPYAASCSWFEAAIVRDFHKGSMTTEEARMKITDELSKQPKARSHEVMTRRRPHHRHSDTWHVQRNRHANDLPMEHTPAWILGETHQEDADFLDSLGRGGGPDFGICSTLG